MEKDKVYDVAIIGGGPAGITAGVYAKRAGLSPIVIEKEKYFGGQVYLTYEVANYTGFDKIAGSDLASKMGENLTANGIPTLHDEILDTVLDSDIKIIKGVHHTIKAETVIIAVGTAVRKLEAENEKKFIGNGVSYSSARDRDRYENKIVAVVGGGNTALEDAIFLSEKAKKVYIIHRRDRFRGDNILAESIAKNKKIEPVWNSKVVVLEGDKILNNIIVENIISGEKQSLPVSGLFVCIGRGAETEFIDEKVIRNENGFIIGNEKMETNLSGVFVAGDIRNTELRQIVCATSDGAIASTSAFKYLGEKRGNLYK